MRLSVTAYRVKKYRETVRCWRKLPRSTRTPRFWSTCCRVSNWRTCRHSTATRQGHRKDPAHAGARLFDEVDGPAESDRLHEAGRQYLTLAGIDRPEGWRPDYPAGPGSTGRGEEHQADEQGQACLEVSFHSLTVDRLNLVADRPFPSVSIGYPANPMATHLRTHPTRSNATPPKPLPLGDTVD